MLWDVPEDRALPPPDRHTPAPNTHSLNELQPLLDVRLPSLPLHQSLRRKNASIRKSVGLVTVHPHPSPPCVPSLPAPSHRVYASVLEAVTHLRDHTDLQHTALHPHLHPHRTLSLYSTFNRQGGSMKATALPHTWLGLPNCTGHPQVQGESLALPASTV